MQTLSLAFGTLALSTFIGSGLGLAQSRAEKERSSGVESSRVHPAIPEETVMVGARLGLQNVDSLGANAVGYGAFGDYSVARNLLVGGTLDYWSDSSGTLLSNSVEVSDLSLGANAKLVFADAKVPFRPFALAGLALHRFNVSYSEEQIQERAVVDKFNRKYSDASSELGIDIGGGVMYRLQPSVDLLGEIRLRRLVDRTLDLDQLAFSGAIAYVL